MLFEKEEKYHFLAIDNAMAFRTGAYQTLTDNTFWATENAYMLQSLFFNQLKRFLKRDKAWLKKGREKFLPLYYQMQAVFCRYCKLTTPGVGFF